MAWRDDDDDRPKSWFDLLEPWLIGVLSIAAVLSGLWSLISGLIG